MKETALISIVDDDESIRDSTRTLLRSAGYKVATFESGELFLESGSIPETECLILDIRMPGMNGLDLQRQLNLANSDVPVIFVTAHDDAMNRKLAIDSGASAFFQKPFSAHDLLTAVQTALKNTLLSPETEVGLANHDSGMPTRTRKTLNHLKDAEWQRVEDARVRLARKHVGKANQDTDAYRQALRAEMAAVENYLEALRVYHAALISDPKATRAAGEDAITPRERQVLALIASGKSSRQIASQLGITFKTVVVHRYHIQTKLNAHNTAQLMIAAIRMGLIEI